MPKKKIEDLNQLYLDAKSVDQEIFAEQRTNLLMIAGEQHTRRGAQFHQHIRSYEKLSSEWKIRLTKNHTQRIVKQIVSNIVGYAPSVAPFPNNPKELADQKATELHAAVWQHIRSTHKLREKTRQWCEDFVGVGEVFAKIFWDPNAGKFMGYEQAIDEGGQPVYQYDEETGRQSAEPDMGKPVFSGDIKYERILGFNLLRAPEGKTLEECPWLCYHKMVQTKELKRIVADDPKKQALVEEDSDETYKVFDTITGSYSSTRNQTMVREFYWRPSPVYPMGYYYITTPKGILFEGELPGGFFPIVGKGWDEIPTTPRARSIIKQLRPYQVEINRCASSVAKAQLTLGDDKLLVQSGSKLSQGGTLPGIRAVNYTGIQPIILPGRSGDQYLQTMQQNIAEMYEVANVVDPFSGGGDKQPAGDAYTMLFASMRDKRKFSMYAEKFEEFLVEVCKSTLEIAKFYYDEQMLIPMVGKNEMVNIAEFKNAEDLHFQIRLEPQTDDPETKMGRTLTFNHILQYTGNNLEREDLGKLIRQMPHANVDGMFDDLTIDYDNATSDILSLDRGKYRAANPKDNHEYIIKRLTHRMKEASYEFLPPQIQQLYDQKMQEHEQMLQQQVQDAQAAKAGFIPSGGYGVRLDFYVDSGNGGTKRATLPYESVQWLMDTLEKQGSTQAMLDKLPQSSQASIGEAMGQAQGGGAQGSAPQGGFPPPLG